MMQRRTVFSKNMKVSVGFLSTDAGALGQAGYQCGIIAESRRRPDAMAVGPMGTGFALKSGFGHYQACARGFRWEP
jgi:hypothetical protein